jgi:membrane associated rhomboid family serine protease
MFSCYFIANETSSFGRCHTTRLVPRLQAYMSNHDHQETPQPTVCYRHRTKASGVRCQRCEQFICAECMHQASVGVHCPECTSNNKQTVYTRATLPANRGLVTQVLIGLNIAVFLLQLVLWDATISTAGTAAEELAVNGPRIDALGQWWRIITGGFGHFGIIHLGMNMYSLYILGPIIERRLGSVSFSLAYVAALVGGSLGALVLDVLSFTMGASGAIFGLLGLLVMMFRSQGISIAQSGLGPVLLLNLFISLSGFVSLGGHGGGFIVGLILGALHFSINAHSKPLFGRDRVKRDIATAALIVVLFVGCLWASSRWMQAAGF